MKHCNGIMHTVRSGDTLYSISMEHQVPLALLLRANPYVDVYNLQVGETICVPVRANDRPGNASLRQKLQQMGGQGCRANDGDGEQIGRGDDAGKG